MQSEKSADLRPAGGEPVSTRSVAPAARPARADGWQRQGIPTVETRLDVVPAQLDFVAPPRETGQAPSLQQRIHVLIAHCVPDVPRTGDRWPQALPVRARLRALYSAARNLPPPDGVDQRIRLARPECRRSSSLSCRAGRLYHLRRWLRDRSYRRRTHAPRIRLERNLLPHCWIPGHAWLPHYHSGARSRRARFSDRLPFYDAPLSLRSHGTGTEARSRGCEVTNRSHRRTPDRTFLLSRRTLRPAHAPNGAPRRIRNRCQQQVLCELVQHQPLRTRPRSYAARSYHRGVRRHLPRPRVVEETPSASGPPQRAARARKPCVRSPARGLAGEPRQ